jgi:hypothetical protein
MESAAALRALPQGCEVGPGCASVPAGLTLMRADRWRSARRVRKTRTRCSRSRRSRQSRNYTTRLPRGCLARTGRRVRARTAAPACADPRYQWRGRSSSQARSPRSISLCSQVSLRGRSSSASTRVGCPTCARARDPSRRVRLLPDEWREPADAYQSFLTDSSGTSKPRTSKAPRVPVRCFTKTRSSCVRLRARRRAPPAGPPPPPTARGRTRPDRALARACGRRRRRRTHRVPGQPVHRPVRGGEACAGGRALARRARDARGDRPPRAAQAGAARV